MRLIICDKKETKEEKMIAFLLDTSWIPINEVGTVLSVRSLYWGLYD